MGERLHYYPDLKSISKPEEPQTPISPAENHSRSTEAFGSLSWEELSHKMSQGMVFLGGSLIFAQALTGGSTDTSVAVTSVGFALAGFNKVEHWWKKRDPNNSSSEE